MFVILLAMGEFIYLLYDGIAERLRDIDSIEFTQSRTHVVFGGVLVILLGTYLREEIQAEGLTRSIGSFGRFLEIAGLSNGEQINFTSVASDVGLSPNTVREYYQILEDTLVGHLLPTFQGTTKRKPVATAKFYPFDVGVANTLRRTG